MKKWYAKALIQKIITYLPFSFHINYWFQKNVTKAVRLNDDFFEDLIRHADILIHEYVAEKDGKFENIVALELGTGWHPIVPIYLFLIGAKEIHTIDLNNHIRNENVRDVVAKFLEFYEDKKLCKYVQKEKIDKLKTLNTDNLEPFFAEMNVKQIVGDINSAGLKNDFYDLCFSVNVLEHVHVNVLTDIIKTLNKISKPNSFHYHSFGCYDHFCHIDKTISKFNYLKYSATAWKLIDNGIQPQNRLRVNQIEDIFKANNYTILKELHSEPNFLEFKKIKVHQDFKDIPTELNAIDYGTFVLLKEN